MPLTDRQKQQLRFVYEIPDIPRNVIVTPGSGVSYPSYYMTSDNNVGRRIVEVFDEVDADPGKLDRVTEILGWLDTFEDDPSSINREGYKFNYKQRLSHVREALYPITGILWTGRGNNRCKIG